MYQIIGYYQAPFEKSSWWGKVLGNPAKAYCFLNPQLYKDHESIPLHNFGVWRVELKGSVLTETSDLENLLGQRISNEISKGIQVGELFIPNERVSIVIKKE